MKPRVSATSASRAERAPQRPGQPAAGAAKTATPKPRSIATAKRKLSMRLLANPSVSGVGIDLDPEGRAQIKVYLAEDVGHAKWIPRTAGGYSVVTEYIGPIEAFDAE